MDLIKDNKRVTYLKIDGVEVNYVNEITTVAFPDGDNLWFFKIGDTDLYATGNVTLRMAHCPPKVE